MFRVFKTCHLFKQNKIFTRRMAAVNLKSLSEDKIYEFLNSFDTVLTDCDGVLWMDMTPIENSPEVMNKFHDHGRQTFYITNNSTKTREEFLAKCSKLNFHATKNNILCTSYLAACYLQDLGFKKKVYVVGSEGVSKELEQVGIDHCGVGPDTIKPGVPYKTFERDPDVGAVIVGFDEHFSYPKLLKAASYLSDENVHFVGTNTDERFPMDGNIVVPGTGSLVRCVETCAERKAVIVGKPDTYISKAIIKRFNINPKRTLMIGDRCNTDILLGTRCGFQTLLVLSGVTSLTEVNTWKQSNSQDELDLLPDYYVDKLGDLLPYLEKFKPTNASATMLKFFSKSLRVSMAHMLANKENYERFATQRSNNSLLAVTYSLSYIRIDSKLCNQSHVTSANPSIIVPIRPDITEYEFLFTGNHTMAASNLKSLSEEELKRFVNSFDVVLSDCDGVLWVENEPIPGSPEVVRRLKLIGKKFFYVTNNNTKTRAEFLEKCEKLQYQAKLEEMMCTSYLVAAYLKEKKFNKKVYIVGKEAIGKELNAVGIEYIGLGPDPLVGDSLGMIENFNPDPDVGAVVVGFDDQISYPKIAKAATYVQNPDVHFIGTNCDNQRPSPNSNIFPGSGCMLRVIEAAANRKAVLLGKPEPYISQTIISKYGLNPERTLMIGDKGDTDILLGKRCGFKTLLVLSGVTSLKDLEKWKRSEDKEERDLVPDYYTDKLSDLLPMLSNS
ncbi:uncharacterized protein LOC124412727 [Diprion similis]|uniref:uncharacterized protein LOC124412727 n=1 Tax=Diprion similis TaxID=362088 RepID=UPI001EF78D33|nr:uncharacterized protein LOC124412727 [Diprion similis]